MRLFSFKLKYIIIQEKFSFKKNEKLKSRKLIQQLFTEGKSFSVFPLRVLYIHSEMNSNILQAAFSVSSKNFKKAVERNRIKRLMREAYRLQKNALQTELSAHQKSFALFFIYTNKTMPDYKIIFEKTNIALMRLQKIITG